MIKDQKKEYLIQQQLAVINENDFNDIEPIKYTKGELIGSGAYGKVYQALDLTNGNLLAIKTIELPLNPE